MRNKSFIVLIVLVGLFYGGSAEAIQILEPMDVFSKTDIGNRTRFHSVAVDSSGRVFGAASDERAVFYFDGSQWRKIEFDSAPLALVADHKESVWVGMYSGVTRLYFDSNGHVQRERVKIDFGPDDDRTMWIGCSIGNDIIFSNSQVSVVLRDGESVIRRAAPDASFQYTDRHQKFMTLNGQKGLAIELGGKREMVEPFAETTVLYAIPLTNGSILAINDKDELVVADNGQLRPFAPSIQDLTDGATIYYIWQYEDGVVGVGTTQGYFDCTVDGQILRFVGEKQGLPDGTVYRSVRTKNGDTWILNDRSIVRLPTENGVQVYRFSEKDCTTFRFLKVNNRIYFCTNRGIFVLEKDKQTGTMNRFRMSSTHDYESTSILSVDGETYITTDSGVLRMADRTTEKVYTGVISGMAPIGKGKIIGVDRNQHLQAFDRSNPNDWKTLNLHRLRFGFSNFQKLDDNSVIAFGFGFKSAIVNYDPNQDKFDVQYVKTNSLPVRVVDIDGQKLVLCQKGLMSIQRTEVGTQLVPAHVGDGIGQIFQNRKVLDIWKLNDIEFAVAQEGMVELIEVGEESAKATDVWHFGKPNELGFVTLSKTEKRAYGISGNVLSIVDLTRSNARVTTRPPILYASFEKKDELLDIKSDTMRLKHNRGIKYEFGMPVGQFSSERLNYQFRLKGHEYQWSPWAQNRVKEYTNLPGGHYKFEVRSRASDDLESVSPITAMNLFVQTPWYLQSWAISIMMFLFIGLLFFTASLRTRSLENANSKMERIVLDRTEELEKQKDQVRQKSAELILKNRESESERLQSLNRMLGGIAHDFNNLMCVVSINSEILELGASETQLPLVEGIKSAGSTAAGLCSQLQSFLGTFPTNAKPVYLTELLKGGTELLRGAVPASLDLKFELKHQTNPVLVDESEIKQVLLNLLVNAGETTCTRVVIETGEAELTDNDLCSARYFGEAPTPGSYAWFKVTDNGPGMNAESLGNIFDPFYSTKRLGRGLGLAIVMRVVARHRGVVFLDTKRADARTNGTVQTGTSFQVCFPITEEVESVPSSYVVQQPANPRRLKVLIVDDEPSILVSLRRFFETMGHDAHIVDGGEQAMALISEGFEMDLAVIDVSMPSLKGDDLAKEILNVMPNISVLLMSGFSEKEIAPDVLEHPRIAFIKKPFSMSEISKTVQSI